jgi:exodeoxyribonuclease VII large subunit
LQQRAQRLDELQNSLRRCYQHHLRQKEMGWRNMLGRLLRLRPTEILHQRKEALIQQTERLRSQLRVALSTRQERMRSAQTRLRLLSPLNVLERGYSITLDAKSGQVIRRNDQIKNGDEILSRLSIGQLRSVVKKTEPEPPKS